MLKSEMTIYLFRCLSLTDINDGNPDMQQIIGANTKHNSENQLKHNYTYLAIAHAIKEEYGDALKLFFLDGSKSERRSQIDAGVKRAIADVCTSRSFS